MPGRLFKALSSTMANSILSLIGITIPIVAFAKSHSAARSVLLIISVILLLVVLIRDELTRRQQVRIWRGDASRMANPAFYEAIQREIVKRSVGTMEDMNDGLLRVYGEEVSTTSVLLYRTLGSQHRSRRSVYATDLTRNPRLLTTRRDYLAANRMYIRDGGTVHRLFICSGRSLADSEFASEFLTVVSAHQAIGAVCGLAVREGMLPAEAVDFVIFADAAVLIEEEQSTSDYQSGRSTVEFRRIDSWRDRFDQLWESGEVLTAPERLAAYQHLASEMLRNGSWSRAEIMDSLGVA